MFKRIKIIKSSKMSFVFVVSVFLLFCSINCGSNSRSSEDLVGKVDEYIHAHLKLRPFSGSVLMAQHGQILVSKGYGMANYELDVPNAPQTKFRLGSITKQFTAMAIAQLQERGLLNVDDPIRKYLPDYPHGDKITIHHLLTHTSGIPNFTSFPEYKKLMVMPLSVEEVIAKFEDKPLEFCPGEKHKYSNSGYILLGYLVEKVSGKPYGTYVKENIFDPLDMKDTGYGYLRPIIKNRASGYSLGKEELFNASYIDMKIPHGAGALHSTVEDLYRWDRALYTEKMASKASIEKMFTAFKDNYGYGWMIDKLFGRRRISHGGGINGFVSHIARFPDDDACITVLSNIETSLSKICRDLAAILFGEAYEFPKKKELAKVDPAVYDLYVGKYQLEADVFVVITKEDNRLFAEVEGQGKAEIFPESETKFFFRVIDIQITFVKNEKGEVTQLILLEGQQETFAKKIE